MEKKRYNTAGRKMLTEYLRAAARTHPQSAEQIYHGLLQTGHAPGQSTVYRLISTMCREGELRRAQNEKGGALYQYVGGEHACDSHFHLQCLSCGRVVHLACACSTEIAAHLLEKHGFAVNSGCSSLFGTCAECRAAKEEHL